MAKISDNDIINKYSRHGFRQSKKIVFFFVWGKEREKNAPEQK